MDKDLPDKQKTASASEWFIIKIIKGGGAERYHTGKCVGTSPVCSAYQRSSGQRYIHNISVSLYRDHITYIGISYNRTSTHYKNGRPSGF